MHVTLMNTLRRFYRNMFVEIVLLLALSVKILSGFIQILIRKRNAWNTIDKWQVWTGGYLAFFIIFHVGVVFVGRFYLLLDTNYYFGAAGLNSFPTNLFFVPYYTFAIISFFGHIATIHYKKMKLNVLGLSPAKQSKIILVMGICITLITFFGLTNHFRGVKIPTEYHVLIGK